MKNPKTPVQLKFDFKKSKEPKVISMKNISNRNLNNSIMGLKRPSL